MLGKLTQRSLWLLAGLASTFAAQAADLTINQFRVRGPAGGNDEFVELFNAGPATLDLSSYKLNASNDSGTASTRLTLPSGTALAPGCYLLLTNSASSGYSGSVAGDLSYASGVTDTGGLAMLDAGGNIVDQVGMSSGSAYKEGTPLASLGTGNTDQGYQRRQTAAGLPQDSADNSADFVKVSPTTPHDRASPCMAMAPALSIADSSVSVHGAGDVAMTFTITLSQPAPDGGVNVHVATGDGTAVAGTDYAAINATLTVAAGQTQSSFNVIVHGRTTPSDDKAFTVTLSDPSGDVALGDANAVGTILYAIPVAAEIWQINGTGQSSPLLGKPVLTHDNVVTAVGPQGFTMQTPDARDDHNLLTSNGVYVYTGSTPTVNVGDAIDATAVVDDYYGLTELKSPAITVLDRNVRLPRAIVFDQSTPSSDPNHLSCGSTNFRCFMSMRVQIEHGTINTGNKHFSDEPYAEVSITANGSRSLRRPGVEFGVPVPDGVNLPNWSGNPEVFKMNTADFGAVPVNTPFNAGSTFSAEGVISYDFGAYTFIPSHFKLTYAAQIPRQVSPTPPLTLRIGAFNMERFCDSVFDTVYTCSGASKEPTPDQVALKTRRLSSYVGSVLRLPDVLSVEEVETLPILRGLAQQLDNDYGVAYDAYLLPGHDPSGINVGFLVRRDRVQALSVRQLAAAETWNDNGQTAYIHDHPPLLLTAQAGGMRFEVIAVHMKARQNVDDDTAAAVRDREKRFLQAKSVATQVQALQKADPRMPLMVVGDFNAYQFSDGWADVVNLIAGRYDDNQNLLKLGGNIVRPELWDAVNSVPENDRYSFLYTENFGEIQGYTKAGSGNPGRTVPTFQVLDHALLNIPARMLFLRMQYGRADLDAPAQTETEAADATDWNRAIGVSDHDGFVVDLFDPLMPHPRHGNHEILRGN